MFRDLTNHQEKSSRTERENQQETQITFGAASGIRTQATLIGSECSHFCADHLASADQQWGEATGFYVVYGDFADSF